MSAHEFLERLALAEMEEERDIKIRENYRRMMEEMSG